VTTLLPVLDVGGTHVAAALVDLDGLRIARISTLPLEAHGSAADIVGSIGAAAAELEAKDAVAWGVAMPGPFDYDAGRGSFAGVDKFAAIAGMDLRAALAPVLGVSPRGIHFLNDADAYTLGEWDAHCQPERLMCATLGTGVGGGFVERGRVVTDDPRVPEGGDFYHLSWRGDPLEDHVSRRAFIREYGDFSIDVKDIAERAAAGDERAKGVLGRGMTVLAETLAPWVQSFAPDVFVIGGAIARSWSVISPSLGAALAAATTHPPDLRPSRLQGEAPLVGAAEFVRSTVFAQEGNVS